MGRFCSEGQQGLLMDYKWEGREGGIKDDSEVSG